MLAAHDLTLRRGHRTVLDALTLDVRPGEVLALLGRNGAGKSTLLKALAGEFTGRRSSLDGHVTLNGRAIETYTANALARLRAVLPQSSPPVFPFTAHDIVAMGRYPHRARGAANDTPIVEAALDLAGAGMLGERDITTLSGGEYARVQFARVLAQLWPSHTVPDVPRYLLLDEPTAALDLAHQHHVLSVIRQLAHDWHLGILTIVHDINLAARHADRIALLADGHIVACGPPAQVMDAALIEHVLGLPVSVVRDAGGAGWFAVPRAAPITPVPAPLPASTS